MFECMYVYMYIHYRYVWCPAEARGECGISWNYSDRCCELPPVCWELYPYPVQKCSKPLNHVSNFSVHFNIFF